MYVVQIVVKLIEARKTILQKKHHFSTRFKEINKAFSKVQKSHALIKPLSLK